jgi:hypothetical protein
LADHACFSFYSFWSLCGLNRRFAFWRFGLQERDDFDAAAKGICGITTRFLGSAHIRWTNGRQDVNRIGRRYTV